MYFTPKEVELIRAAAAAMPLGGARDTGKAQLSSLADIAGEIPLEALILQLDIRSTSEPGKPPKIAPAAADKLRALLYGLGLSAEEKAGIENSEDELCLERALRHKRAIALRFANKLRKHDPARNQDRGGGRSFDKPRNNWR